MHQIIQSLEQSPLQMASQRPDFSSDWRNHPAAGFVNGIHHPPTGLFIPSTNQTGCWHHYGNPSSSHRPNTRERVCTTQTHSHGVHKALRTIPIAARITPMYWAARTCLRGTPNRPNRSTTSPPPTCPSNMSMTVIPVPISEDRYALHITRVAPSNPPTHIHHGLPFSSASPRL